jgi:hypothetical protein
VNKLYLVTEPDNITHLTDENPEKITSKEDNYWNCSKIIVGVNIFNQTWGNEPIEVALVKVVKPKKSGVFRWFHEGCRFEVQTKDPHCRCGAKLDWSEG